MLNGRSSAPDVQIDQTLVADRGATGNKTLHGQDFCHELRTTVLEEYRLQGVRKLAVNANVSG